MHGVHRFIVAAAIAALAAPGFSEPAGKPGGTATLEGESAESSPLSAKHLLYEYDYRHSFRMTPGTLPEDAGLPEAYAEVVRGDAEVDAVCIDGVVRVVFDGKQLYVRTTVTSATGHLADGRTKSVAHRYPEVTEQWLFGDGTASTTTSGGPAGGPEGRKLAIEPISMLDTTLMSSILPPALALKFGIEPTMPSPGAGGAIRDMSINCDDVIKIDKETPIPGAIAYESRVPLRYTVQGDVPENAMAVTDVVQDAATMLPLELESWLDMGTGNRGAGTPNRLQPTYAKYEWTPLGRYSIPKFMHEADGEVAIAAARGKAPAGADVFPPPRTIILRLKSALAGEAALREGGVPVLPDTKEIQDNTVSPPHTIK